MQYDIEELLFEDAPLAPDPGQQAAELPTFEDLTAKLNLVRKRVNVRFCEFKISNTPATMLRSEAIAASNLGMLFTSAVDFHPSRLLRVWVDLPDYWARKSSHVAYRHIDAPRHFQMLCRVIRSDDTGRRTDRYQLLLETVNIDSIDEQILCEFLGIEAPKR